MKTLLRLTSFLLAFALYTQLASGVQAGSCAMTPQIANTKVTLTIHLVSPTFNAKDILPLTIKSSLNGAPPLKIILTKNLCPATSGCTLTKSITFPIEQDQVGTVDITAEGKDGTLCTPINIQVFGPTTDRSQQLNIAPNAAVLDALNPLTFLSTPELKEQLSTPRGFISRVLEFAFPLAGMILFVMILWGGFEILAGASSKKSLDAGRQRITAALLGFLLLFVSFWIARVLELLFGIKILG